MGGGGQQGREGGSKRGSDDAMEQGIKQGIGASKRGSDGAKEQGSESKVASKGLGAIERHPGAVGAQSLSRGYYCLTRRRTRLGRCGPRCRTSHSPVQRPCRQSSKALAATQHPRGSTSPAPVPRPDGSRAPARGAATQHPRVRSSTAPVPPGTAPWHSSTATAARRRGRHATALPVSLLRLQPVQRLVVHFWEVELKTPLQ